MNRWLVNYDYWLIGRQSFGHFSYLFICLLFGLVRRALNAPIPIQLIAVVVEAGRARRPSDRRSQIAASQTWILYVSFKIRSNIFLNNNKKWFNRTSTDPTRQLSFPSSLANVLYIFFKWTKKSTLRIFYYEKIMNREKKIPPFRANVNHSV